MSVLQTNTVLKLDTTLDFASFFTQYPTLTKALHRLSMRHPTFLQADILNISSSIENLTISVNSSGHGSKLGLILYILKKFVNMEGGIFLLLCHSKEASFEMQ